MRTYSEVQIDKPNIAERLAYIDFKLRFTGIVKRSEIGEMFNIAEAASSKMLAEYSAEREFNMDYDRTLRANAILRETYEPLLQLDADVALAMLAYGFNKNKISSPIGALVPFEKIDKVPNQLSVDCIAKITRAISGGYAISCKYYSENSENHDERVLIPLAIMSDGVNWIFRGYHRGDPSEIFFKNFHFSRVRDVTEHFDLKECKRLPHEALSQDKEWNLKIPLELRLHSSLDEKAKKRFRVDFGMEDGAEEIMIPVRCAYLWILTKKWFIDRRDHEKRGKDLIHQEFPFYKFELVNRETVDFLQNNIS